MAIKRLAILDGRRARGENTTQAQLEPSGYDNPHAACEEKGKPQKKPNETKSPRTRGNPQKYGAGERARASNKFKFGVYNSLQVSLFPRVPPSLSLLSFPSSFLSFFFLILYYLLLLLLLLLLSKLGHEPRWKTPTARVILA